MKAFCMEFKFRLYGILKILYFKRQIWETLPGVCVPVLLPSQLTSWLEEPASQFREHTRHSFLESSLKQERGLLTQWWMVLKRHWIRGLWKEVYFLIRKKKKKKLCFLPGLNVVSQRCEAWSSGYNLGIWGESKRIAGKAIFIQHIKNQSQNFLTFILLFMCNDNFLFVKPLLFAYSVTWGWKHPKWSTKIREIHSDRENIRSKEIH